MLRASLAKVTQEQQTTPVVTKAAISNKLESDLADLQGILDESKKAASISKVEKALSTLDPNQVEGIDDVKKAIQDYKDIKKAGMTLEDYQSEKEAAFEAINNSLADLSIIDTEPLLGVGKTVQAPGAATFGGQILPLDPTKPPVEFIPITKVLGNNETIEKQYPEQFNGFKKPEHLVFAEGVAKRNLESMQTGLESVMDKDTEKTINKTFSKLSRDTGIRSSRLKATQWSDLTADERTRLAMNAVPAGTVKFQLKWRGWNSGSVFADIEESTGLPFATLYERIDTMKDYAKRIQDEKLRVLESNPRFRWILHNDKNLERVAAYINHQYDPSIQVPTDMHQEEIELANEISAGLKEWEPVVRYLRFLEAYEDSRNPKTMKKSIKDAPENDLEFAARLMDNGDKSAVWAFLFDKTWGVIQSGYDPRQVVDLSLFSKLPGLSTTRGMNRLITREEVSSDLWKESSIVRRYDTYNRSMASALLMRDTIKDFADYLKLAEQSFDQPEEFYKYIRQFLRAEQGFPDEKNIWDYAMRRLQRVAYQVVFVHPALGIRNMVQPFWGYTHRTELFKAPISYQSLPESLKAKASAFFDFAVDQTRPIRDWMFETEELTYPGQLPAWMDKTFRGKLSPINWTAQGIELMANLSGKIPTMAFTDRLTRGWVFKASFVKAWRATEQYSKDGNFDHWRKASRILELTTGEQKQVIRLLNQDTVDLNLPGLRSMTGHEAVNECRALMYMVLTW